MDITTLIIYHWYKHVHFKHLFLWALSLILNQLQPHTELHKSQAQRRTRFCIASLNIHWPTLRNWLHLIWRIKFLGGSYRGISVHPWSHIHGFTISPNKTLKNNTCYANAFILILICDLYKYSFYQLSFLNTRSTVLFSVYICWHC